MTNRAAPAQSPVAARPDWITPRVAVLRASAAANGAGNRSDDAVNRS